MVKKKEHYNIALLGAGSWGITLANLLYENSNRVALWEFDLQQAQRLKKNRRYITLKGFRIPKEIKITSSMQEAVSNADYIIISVPSIAIKSVSRELSNIRMDKQAVIVSTIKGFEQKSLKRPSEVLRDYLGRNIHIAVLSGPSHAEEVIEKVPTAVVAASINKDTKLNVQKLFSNQYFRVYTSFDIKGVELGGALKNVIAIGAGISSGLKMGDNTKAALITRGNAEIARLGVKLGARKETFIGLSGIGDLIVTCFSEHSRNFRFGRFIGMGYSLEDALKKTRTTVEGIYAARSCFKLSKKLGVQMPVCNKIYQILFKRKPADKAWKELMNRPLRSETLNGSSL